MEPTMLSDDEKQQVASIVLDAARSAETAIESKENDKIILHYFTRLQEFYRNLQEEEQQVNEFCEMCNKYLSFNEVVYDESSYTCRIKPVANRRATHRRIPDEISLESLSSGEKQIVGLFSKLILEDEQDLFVIIDEPEISLSMDWQRSLLPDMLKARNTRYLIAATHSPFMFENELEDSAHGLNEFLVEEL